MSNNEDILKRIYYWCDQGYDQVASELALKYIEHKLRSGDFSVVDALLKDADVEHLSASTLLNIVTITAHGKAHLPSRLHFLEQAEQKMVQDVGKERAENWLNNRR